MRLVRVLTVGLFVGSAMCVAVPVHAQRAAEASTGDPTRAADLAHRSMQLLKQAEEGNPPSKSQCYTDALELARQAAAMDDTNADAHFVIFAATGRLMLERGAIPNPFNLFEVSKQLDRALELNPRHSDALASKGGLARQLPTLLGGSLSKAEKYLQQSIECDPDAVGARIELARVYLDMGHDAEAIDLLHTAASLAERQGRAQKLAEAQQLLTQVQQSK